MYETGNQKDRDRKCITLRDPRGQRYWDEARSVAERTECTGCRYRICCAVPCYRTGCRTRGINLNIVSKCTQRPAGRCCFYRRFVCFNMMLLRGVNDSPIYQFAKRPDSYSLLNFKPSLNASPILPDISANHRKALAI